MILEWIKEWALPLSAGATLVLAIVAFLAIWQNRNLQRKGRRERLLKDIVDWLTSVRTIDLGEPIPITDKEITEQEQNRIEHNVLNRYVLSIVASEYIRAMVRKTFKRELARDVDEIIIILHAFIYIRSVRFGFKNAKDAFRGIGIDIVEEVENQITEGKKTEEQLFKEYGIRLFECTTKLIVKVGNLMAKH